MLSRPFVRVILAGAAVALIAMAVLLALSLAQGERVEPAPQAEIAAPAPTPAVPPADAEATAELAMAEASVEADPRRACDKPLGELSEECLQSLDAYFLDRPFVWKGFDWLPLPLTYRRVFADPALDRERTLAALDRAECRLEHGEVRWDLKETCHADSLASYATFIYFCQHAGEAGRSIEVGKRVYVPIMTANGLEAVQTTLKAPTMYQMYADWDAGHLGYFTESEWAGETFLEGRWVLERSCVRHDVEVLALDVDRDRAQYEKLEAIWERLRDPGRKHYYGISGSEDASEVLTALAARLGDEWAAFVHDSPKENDAWDDHEAEALPWKRHLRAMRLTMRNLRHASEARATALRLSLEAWEELEKAGLRIDLDRLVEYVCGHKWSDRSDACQAAIADLNETGTETDQGFWHKLSAFEARAMQLGLYDAAPSYRWSDWEQNALLALDPEGFHAKWTPREEQASD